MTIYGQEYPHSVVSLARYAQIIGYSDCAFFGVSHPSNVPYACTEIWSKDQRDTIAFYLAEAQDEIEMVLQYPLEVKWFENERHDCSPIILANYGRIVDTGVKVEDDISLDSLVDHTTDPATSTVPMDLPTYDYKELKIYYPDSDIEITPSNIQYIGANLVISIPRCRLIKYDLIDNPSEGLIYSDDANFQTTIDIKRIHNDPTIQARFVYSNSRRCNDTCQETYQYVCQYIDNREIGKFTFGSNSYSSHCTTRLSFIELNYSAGMQTLTRQAESMIVRLAHSKMPVEPCGCDITQRLWARDRKVPDLVTRERIDCPFGMSDGAWVSWIWATTLQLQRASALYRRQK